MRARELWAFFILPPELNAPRVYSASLRTTPRIINGARQLPTALPAFLLLLPYKQPLVRFIELHVSVYREGR